MPNITDARDASLGGKAVFEEWMRDFEIEWLDIDVKKIMLDTLAGELDQAPQEVHQVLREMDPQAYDEVMKQLGG